MRGTLDSSRRTTRKNPILDYFMVGRCYLPESLPQPPKVHPHGKLTHTLLAGVIKPFSARRRARFHSV